MNNIIAVCLIVVSVLGSLSFLCNIPFIKNKIEKKGINVDKELKTGVDVLDGVKTMTATLKGVAPSAITSDLDIIAKWADIGAHSAQENFHIGNLSVDERAKHARDITVTALKLAKYEVTPERMNLINSTIDSVCDKMGHPKVLDAKTGNDTKTDVKVDTKAENNPVAAAEKTNVVAKAEDTTKVVDNNTLAPAPKSDSAPVVKNIPTPVVESAPKPLFNGIDASTTVDASTKAGNTIK